VRCCTFFLPPQRRAEIVHHGLKIRIAEQMVTIFEPFVQPAGEFFVPAPPWQRWHNRRGRLKALRRLKAQPYHLTQASGSVGAWRKARSPMLQTVLDKARLRRWGLCIPSDLAAT